MTRAIEDQDGGMPRCRTRVMDADVGVAIRRAREGRGLSLVDLSSRTNIPRVALEKLERNVLEELPGGLIFRGYLRAIGGEVGLDGERLILQAEPYAPAEIDVLDRLRTRFHAVDHTSHNVLQLLVVLGCLAGLFYVLAMHDATQTASTAAPQEVLLEPAGDS